MNTLSATDPLQEQIAGGSLLSRISSPLVRVCAIVVLAIALTTAWWVTPMWFALPHRMTLGIGLWTAGISFWMLLRNRLGLALLLTSMVVSWLLLTPAGIGDVAWKDLASGTQPLFGSSMLGHLILKIVFMTADSITFQPVLAGVLTIVLACAPVLRRSFLRGEKATGRQSLYVGAICTSSTLILFFSGLAEVTMYALPFALACLWAIGAYGHASVHTCRLAAGGALAALAALTHGSMLVLVPVVLVAAALQMKTLRSLAATVTAYLVTVGVFFVTIFSLGLGVQAGDASGGGDRAMFAHDFWSLEHISMVAHLLVVSHLALLGLLASGLGRGRRAASDMRYPFVAILSAFATWGFVTMWGFDLGWPRDGDLMVVTAPLAWPLLYSAIPQRLRWWHIAIVVVGMLISVLTLFQLATA